MSELADVTAERALLGSIMFDGKSIHQVTGRLQPDDFYRKTYGIVFGTMLNMAQKKLDIDAVTLHKELTANGELERVGGMPMITDLACAINTATNIKQYTDIVLEMSARRKCAEAGEIIKADAEDLTKDFSLVNAQRMLSNISMRKSNTIPTMFDNMVDFNTWLNERATNGGKGVYTGFSALDVATHGWQQQNLIILAARPSMGKTAFALNLAVNAAKAKRSVLFISLEMSKEELDARMAASICGVENDRIRNPNTMTDAQWAKVQDAIEVMHKWNMTIIEHDASTPERVESIAREVKGERGLDLIIIDYLQLMNVDGKENRTQEVSYLSRSLKLLAKDLDVPIIALSQLSRAVESRQDKHPMLSDLRESGSIEQDADIVMFLYRDAYYDTQSNSPYTDLQIAKNRNGALAMVTLAFKPEISLFVSAVKPPAGGVPLQQEEDTMNSVTLIGRMAKDAEIRHTQSGKAVASFSVACDRGQKDTQGKTQADFINCVAWKKTAELIGKWFPKGKPICVEGRIQTRKYQAKDGSNRYATEVVVNKVEFLPREAQNQQNGGQAPQNNGWNYPESPEIPF